MARTWDEIYAQMQTAAALIADALNGANGDTPDKFIEAMARQHRTLQQAFTGLCIRWFEHLAKLKDYEYDLRNEDSVKFAKALVESDAYKEQHYLRYI